MKRILVLFLFAYFFSRDSKSQSYPIYSAIGPYFIQGITGVVNQFQVDGTNVPNGTVGVNFFIQNTTYSTSYASGAGTYDSQNQIFYWNFDMGQLPINTPNNIVVFAAYHDGSNYLAYSDDYNVNLIPSPSWLNTTYQGQIFNVVVDYNTQTIDMDGYLPLANLSSNNSVTNVLGLNTKKFKLLNPELTFQINYNTQDGSSTVYSSSFNTDLGALANNTNSLTSTAFSGNLTFDNNFNLTLNGLTVWSPPTITKSFDFKNVPLVGANTGILNGGALCVNTELEFSLAPKIKAQIVAGYNPTYGQWGFLSNGVDATQLLGKVTATAKAKGELKAVCGSALGFNFGFGTLARGEITATMTIGGGVKYVSVPNTNLTPLWMGDFNIYAYGEIAGIGSKSGNYNRVWGSSLSNNFNFRITNTINDFFKSETFKVHTNPTPSSWPKGELSSRDSILATAWLDNINFGQNSALLACYYNPTINTFSSPVIVAQNDSGIVNHSIALLPNKDILITWSQLSITENQANSGSYTPDDISKRQNIWFAIIDPNSNTLIYKAQLTDNSGLTAEGNPKIHWGNSNQGMITWQIGDVQNGGSDLYYSIINESSGFYTFSTPQIINNTIGSNYETKIAYTNGNKLMATWINDPDNNPTTNNSKIYYNIWNGSSWTFSAPLLRFTIPSNVFLKEYSLATSGNYGVEALTYNYFTNDSNLINGVFIGRWTDGNPESNNYQIIQEEDSTYNFQIPRVSVSRNGIASLNIQIRDLLDPTDEGRINLFMKDLNFNSSWENVAETNPSLLGFISDPNQFVWDMSTKYGYLQSANSSDILYLFTQEMDNLGNTNPTHGEIFGDPNLNLVLRALKVSSNNGSLTITDVAEPTTGNVIGFYQNIKSFNNYFEIKQNYPNPFNNSTKIPYHIYKQARVKIEVFDLMGKNVGVIVDEVLSPGDYESEFTAVNLEAGIYYYKISTPEFSSTKKMIITK